MQGIEVHGPEAVVEEGEGLLRRTMRSAHPWSNGKVEALNKVLKCQCFPAVAGNITDWQSACVLAGRWMVHYNEQSSHGGFANKGLPPLAFWHLYESTPGDHLQKLVKLGLLKLDQEWSVRLMGSNMSMEQQQDKIGDVVSSDGPDDRPEKHEIPFALVLEKRSQGSFQPDLREPTDGGGSQLSRPAPNVMLAK